jgi:hypothetical protein
MASAQQAYVTEVVVASPAHSKAAADIEGLIPLWKAARALPNCPEADPR